MLRHRSFWLRTAWAGTKPAPPQALSSSKSSRSPQLSRVTAEWVIESFARADSRIRFGAGGGTTVAGMVVVQQDSNPYWLFFNIGDSRVYRCADGVLAQVSVDHSVVQELVDEGRIEPEAN